MKIIGGCVIVGGVVFIWLWNRFWNLPQMIEAREREEEVESVCTSEEAAAWLEEMRRGK